MVEFMPNHLTHGPTVSAYGPTYFSTRPDEIATVALSTDLDGLRPALPTLLQIGGFWQTDRGSVTGADRDR